jgi:hypothetical protein
MEIKELLQGLKEQLDRFDAIDEYKESCTTLYLYHSIKKITELEAQLAECVKAIDYCVKCESMSPKAREVLNKIRGEV